jgi:hypothetical protein
VRLVKVFSINSGNRPDYYNPAQQGKYSARQIDIGGMPPLVCPAGLALQSARRLLLCRLPHLSNTGNSILTGHPNSAIAAMVSTNWSSTRIMAMIQPATSRWASELPDEFCHG